MGRGTVAAAFVRGLVDYAATLGVDRNELIAHAAVTSDELTNPDRRVPIDKYVLLIRAAGRLSGDPAFALHFGEAVDIREMSIVALLGQSLGTAMEAFEAVNRYARLDADIDVEGKDRLQLLNRSGRLWLVDRRTNPNDAPEITEATFARMVCGGRRAGMEMPLKEVHVTHPEPAYRSEYERIFGVPITFGSDWNALNIDESAMAQRMGLQPAYAGRILTARADELLRNLDSSRTIRGEVEAALRHLLNGRKATTIAAVAGELGLGRQTLYRRLKREGTTFEQVRKDLRLQLAQDYLASGQLSVSEIGYRLGFADAPTFSKAFKRWTGASPGGRGGERATSGTAPRGLDRV